MSKFEDNVKQDTPRLVVLFKRDGKNETFNWGIVGAIPMLSLAGAVIHVQSELFSSAGEECPEPALVITWDDAQRVFDWYVHPSVPVEPLVGMLELIKNGIISQIAKQPVLQQSILGPDGRPIPR